MHVTDLWGADQLTYLQQLVYLLPPCNCDTLLTLLTLLHTVQEHAHDSVGPDQQEVAHLSLLFCSYHYNSFWAL